MNKIVNIRIIKDKKTGVSKGISYVDFESEEDAVEACESNGIEIDGRRLFVALSDPPKKG